MGFILSFIALILLAIVHIVDFLLDSTIGVAKRKWFKVVSKRHFRTAFVVDVFANYTYQSTWNLLFSTGGYEFGRLGETLSSCFGKKRKENSLTMFGIAIRFIIDVVDFTKWFKGGHCVASIMNDKQINNTL